MPTINVTNATVTGTITYDDAPVPPDPVNTAGKITKFNAQNGSMIQIDGVNAEVEHDPSKSYSIANPDPYTLHFEVHSGDRWTSPNHTDPTTSERSEIEIWDGRRPAGTDIIEEHGFLMEPGGPNTADWMILGQWHQTNSGGNPPFAFAMYGERFHVLIRDSTNKENRIFADTKNIQRGHKYKLRTEVKFDHNGYCRVWRDDIQIVDFKGEIGFGTGEQYYWKNGIYRNEAPEVMAVKYSNLHFG
jgi:hypothetical protein